MRFKHIFLIISISFCVNISAQSTAYKQVAELIIEAPQLNIIKTIWVYLPKNYQKSRKRYPVIHMHHAKNLFDVSKSYIGEWQIDEYLHPITENESILIGIEHAKDIRIDELTPFRHIKYGGGNGNAYLNFIKNILKSFFNYTYLTLTDVEHTTLFDFSLGGLISFYGTVKFPETYRKAGVFSPAFWINCEIYSSVESLEMPETSKFYFLIETAESEEMIPDQKRMVSFLKYKGVNDDQLKSLIIKGGEHKEKFWSTHFADACQ
jgi:predicted alpha/beta superfamily hydrolase